MLYVFLAQGFEEMEAVVTVDMLRRAKLPVTTVGVGGNIITGSHGIPVLCDAEDTQVCPGEDCQAVILPGGLPGTKNLEQSETVQAFLQYALRQERYVCAICAAPSILGRAGYLQGKNAVCFPGYEAALTGAAVGAQPACRDGNIITGRSAGTAVEFAAEIITAFCGREQANAIKESMRCV